MAVKVSPSIQALIDNGLFDRLPVSFSAFCLEQMKDWDLLFPAERSYFERLFSLLNRSGAGETDRLFQNMRAAEQLMGINDKTWGRRQFTLEQVDFLNRNPHYPEWRAAVSEVFAKIDPILNAETAKNGKPRLVIVTAPADLPVDPDRMWLRIAAHGRRVAIRQPDDLRDFLPLLLSGQPQAAGAPSIAALYSNGKSEPYESWIINASKPATTEDAGTVVRCCYGELEPYRKRLMTEVNRMVGDKDLHGPRELSARLKQMKVLSSEGHIARDAILSEFVRATLLSGNGTLLINNTFVEWATIQAIRRAKPSVAVVGFGIRNKVKPFSSLLIYADQEQTNPIPTQADTLGTYVDLEVFYQYVWQEFEKYAEYRRNTAYLFVAEGMDQMLMIAPPDFPLKLSSEAVALPSIYAGCCRWLGI